MIFLEEKILVTELASFLEKKSMSFKNDCNTIESKLSLLNVGQLTRKSHFWIFFPEMTLPDVPKRVWIFSENDAISVPVFLNQN